MNVYNVYNPFFIFLSDVVLVGHNTVKWLFHPILVSTKFLDSSLEILFVFCCDEIKQYLDSHNILKWQSRKHRGYNK